MSMLTMREPGRKVLATGAEAFARGGLKLGSVSLQPILAPLLPGWGIALRKSTKSSRASILSTIVP